MIIRQEQMQTFEDAAVGSFESEMIAHLKSFTPKHAELLGDAGLESMIRHGRERAAKHGFITQGAVRFYIEMMFLFGSDFDSDPQYPWAAEILNNPALGPGDAKADLLYEKAMDYLDTVTGPNRQFTIAALGRTRQASQPPPPPGPIEAHLIAGFRQVHPEKSAYLGEAGLRSLVRRATEVAGKHGPVTDRSVMLFSAMMFAMGHGFTTDPQYPWVRNTLENKAISDPAKRIERLESKALTYLDGVLSYFGTERA